MPLETPNAGISSKKKSGARRKQTMNRILPDTTQKTNPKITNRPWLNQPERPCLCGRTYRYPWAWAITLPGMTLIDLCATCSRVLRYGSEAERQEMAERLASASEWRLAA